MAALALALVAGVGVCLLVREPQSLKGTDSEISSQAKRAQHFYQPTDAEWVTLTVEPVREQAFRTELVTEGKIAVDEDRSTPIFSPLGAPRNKPPPPPRQHRTGDPAAVHH